jgi:GTP-binding protein Era
VGKSTLVNALCGGKVAIVSDKPQTTRRRIFGIANGDDYQLVLADLPGFQRPLDALTERMQKTVDAAFEEVEAVVFVLSARERIGAGDRFIASRVFGLGVPVVIALNKVDRLKAGHIATQMNVAAKLGEFHALHPVSAKTGDGVRELREELGIEARSESEIMTLSHEYPDRIVDLVLCRARLLRGEPRGLDGQALKWVDCQSLGNERLLPADEPFIAALQLLSSRPSA